MPFQKGNTWGKAQKGFRHTEETKKKIGKAVSFALKGRIPKNLSLIDANKKGSRNPMWGKHWNENQRREIMKSLIGRKVSPETRRKISEAQRGEKCRLWKGGISTIYEKIRRSSRYKAWRKSVFQRDSYTCIWCGVCNGNGRTVVLNADHIKPFASYPKLRFDIKNGRTLCVDCHKKTGTWGRPSLSVK